MQKEFQFEMLNAFENSTKKIRTKNFVIFAHELSGRLRANAAAEILKIQIFSGKVYGET